MPRREPWRADWHPSRVVADSADCSEPRTRGVCVAAPHDGTVVSLANINYGDLEGLTLTEVSERFPFNLEHTLCFFRENCGVRKL